MEIIFEGGKVVTAYSHGHVIKTDQAVHSGGQDSAPSPYELFLASIGTCSGIYVKSFCDNRNIPTENIKLIQTLMKRPGFLQISVLTLNSLLIFRRNIRKQ